MKEYKSKLAGVYLVADPSRPPALLLERLEESLRAGARLVQLWDNWPAEREKAQLIPALLECCRRHDALVLVNNDWRLLLDWPFDGVHFDEPLEDLPYIRHSLGRRFITGLTCHNDFERLFWARENEVDYISFCAMFPSTSAGNCQIVDFSTVQKAREIVKVPIFLSGGISPERMPLLKELPFDGVAVISGILDATDALEATRNYQKGLKKP